MIKNRPFKYALLILLLLNLLVYFFDLSPRRNAGSEERCEQEIEDVLEELSEAEEQTEDKREGLRTALQLHHPHSTPFSNSYTTWQFSASAAQASPLSCGWSIPLRI